MAHVAIENILKNELNRNKQLPAFINFKIKNSYSIAYTTPDTRCSKQNPFKIVNVSLATEFQFNCDDSFYSFRICE